jgi:hypothetical protein
LGAELRGTDVKADEAAQDGQQDRLSAQTLFPVRHVSPL